MTAALTARIESVLGAVITVMAAVLFIRAVLVPKQRTYSLSEEEEDIDGDYPYYHQPHQAILKCFHTIHGLAPLTKKLISRTTVALKMGPYLFLTASQTRRMNRPPAIGIKAIRVDIVVQIGLVRQRRQWTDRHPHWLTRTAREPQRQNHTSHHFTNRFARFTKLRTICTVCAGVPACWNPNALAISSHKARSPAVG
jgi:hypothetical protein